MTAATMAMFASASLARRIEAAEAALTRAVGDLVARAQPEATVRYDGDGAVGLSTAAESPFDKVIGLGFAPGDWDAFDRFEAEALARGRRVQVEQSTLAELSVGERLTSRGYRLVGFENVLGRALGGEAARATPSVEIADVGDDEFAAWTRVVADGFAAPDRDDGPGSHDSFDAGAIVAVLEQLRGVPGFRRSLARLDGVVVGAASWRAHEGIAQLTGAATLPAYRRRGVQTALLAARLAEAAAAGCELAVLTAAPGSRSQENAMRAGFSLLYARAILLSRAK
jgi:ribosomal protein S18 acetylase RimI-like enzyme